MIFLFSKLLNYPPSFIEDFFLHSWQSAMLTVEQCLTQPCVEAAELLQRAGTRLVLIHGDRDGSAPFHLAASFAQRLGCGLVRIDGGDHSCPLRHFAAVHAALRRNIGEPATANGRRCAHPTGDS